MKPPGPVRQWPELLRFKDIAMEAGHICQNLYLAAESIGGGACAILGYDQASIDEFVGVDGKEEFVIYLSPAGKIEQKE